MIHPVRFASVTALASLQLEYRVCRAEKERKKRESSIWDRCSIVAYYTLRMLMVVVMPAIAKVSPLYSIRSSMYVQQQLAAGCPGQARDSAGDVRGDGAGCWDLSTMGSWKLDQWNGFPFSP